MRSMLDKKKKKGLSNLESCGCPKLLFEFNYFTYLMPLLIFVNLVGNFCYVIEPALMLFILGLLQDSKGE